MAKGLITHAYLEDTADAIRVLRGESDTYTPDEFDEKILDAIPDVTVTDSIVSVTDAAAYPAEGLEFAIEPVQEGSGDPSPENIRPISGWTGVNGERTGKNLFDKNFADWEVRDSYIVLDKKLPPNVEVNMSFTNNDTSVDLNGIYLGFILNYTSGAPVTYRWIIQGNNINTSKSNLVGSVYCNQIFAYPSSEATFNKIKQRYNIQVELGSTATTYEPYQGTSISVAFPTEAGTVYGGKVDVVNGKLRVDRAEVDLGDFGWSKSGSQFVATSPANAFSVYYMNPDYIPFKCSHYKSTSTNPTNGEITMNNQNTGISAVIRIVDNRYTDSTDFQAAMSGVQLVYKLATPIEYDITPQQVQMLLGDNNVWCDTGDTTLEYKVDLGRYIEKLKAAQATPQLSLSRQAVSLDAARDAEVRTDEDSEDSESIDTDDVR